MLKCNYYLEKSLQKITNHQKECTEIPVGGPAVAARVLIT